LPVQEGQAAIYLSYQIRGEPFHGILYPPRDWVPGRSYPTVAVIYEALEDSPFGVMRSEGHIFSFLHQAGYALLFPHIQPLVDRAGPAALESVEAAVNAAVQSGITDRERLALTGHSFGGYESFFIATHSDMFKLIVPMAGVADLSANYTSSGGPLGLRWPLIESTQPYLSRPWWEAPDIYALNSPLLSVENLRTPLLIVHGDADPAVPFANAASLFAASHRLNRSPVVMLQYTGEDHVSIQTGAVWADVSTRMLQLLDHFLKGAVAPLWWRDGMSYPQGQAPVANSAVRE